MINKRKSFHYAVQIYCITLNFYGFKASCSTATKFWCSLCLFGYSTCYLLLESVQNTEYDTTIENILYKFHSHHNYRRRYLLRKRVVLQCFLFVVESCVTSRACPPKLLQETHARRHQALKTKTPKWFN